MITQAQRDRAYHVLMAALAEEAAVRELPDAELTEKSNAIWDDCYGDKETP
jgi:hypothetical protein